METRCIFEVSGQGTGPDGIRDVGHCRRRVHRVFWAGAIKLAAAECTAENAPRCRVFADALYNSCGYVVAFGAAGRSGRLDRRRDNSLRSADGFRKKA